MIAAHPVYDNTIRQLETASVTEAFPSLLPRSSELHFFVFFEELAPGAEQAYLTAFLLPL